MKLLSISEDAFYTVQEFLIKRMQKPLRMAAGTSYTASTAKMANNLFLLSHFSPILHKIYSKRIFSHVLSPLIHVLGSKFIKCNISPDIKLESRF